MVKKRRAVKKSSSKNNLKKTWLILGISVLVLVVLSLVLYSPAREAVFGKAIGDFCYTDNDCSIDTPICMSGECVAAVLCVSDRDCPTTNQYCEGGVCLERPDIFVKLPAREVILPPEPLEPLDSPRVLDPCLSVTCPPGQQCISGQCYPTECEGGEIECPGLGLVCLEECPPVVNPCEGVVCPENQECTYGFCYPIDLCRDVACPWNKVCVEGECVKK
ncbi:hypothetical protein GOV03_03015 [Candidatus Woesearchaeota archaeon]|nr:hypothetical protein [Candidatus Woesearchaeota archaeon]